MTRVVKVGGMKSQARVDGWADKWAAVIAAGLRRPREAVSVEPPVWARPGDEGAERAVWDAVLALSRHGGVCELSDLERECRVRGCELDPGLALRVMARLEKSEQPPVALCVDALVDEARYHRALGAASVLLARLEARADWPEVGERLADVQSEIGRVSTGAEPENVAEWMEREIARAELGPEVRAVRMPVGDNESIMPDAPPGALITIGAHTSIGKTTFALNAMVNLGAQGIPSGFVSLEDPPELVAKRLFKLANSHPKAADAREAAKWIRRMGIEGVAMVDETDDVAVVDSMARLADKGCRCVFIDYLGQIERRLTGRWHDDRRNQIRKAVTRIKGAGVRLGMPVVLFSQFNRENVTAKRERPEEYLGAFKESGDIENKSEIVIALLRHGEPERKELDAHVLKNKIDGRLFKVPLRIDPNTMRMVRRVDTPSDPPGA